MLVGRSAEQAWLGQPHGEKSLRFFSAFYGFLNLTVNT
jgi:hypothetical protein